MTNGKDETPQLTEIQQVRLENFTLKHVHLQNAFNQNMAERAAYCQSIAEQHPGWRWSDPDGLVKDDDKVQAVTDSEEEKAPGLKDLARS